MKCCNGRWANWAKANLTITISIATGLILIHSSEKEEDNKK